MHIQIHTHKQTQLHTRHQQIELKKEYERAMRDKCNPFSH